jgi:hypothetical protein
MTRSHEQFPHAANYRGLVVIAAALLAAVAFLLDRRQAAGDLLFSAVLIVGVEVIYTINKSTGMVFTKRDAPQWMQGIYLAGALLFWGLATVGLFLGIYRVLRP